MTVGKYIVPKVKVSLDLSAKVAHIWMPSVYLNIPFSQKPQGKMQSNFIWSIHETTSILVLRYVVQGT